MIRTRKLLKNQTRGSLTVEAALCLPIFLFVVIIFLYLLEFVRLQQGIQHALHETADYYAKYAYVNEKVYEQYDSTLGKEIKEFTEVLDVQEHLTSYICERTFEKFLRQKNQNLSTVVGGIDGICILQCGDYFEDGTIDLCAYYSYQIPGLLFRLKSFSCMQRVVTKGWLGEEVAAKFGEVEKNEAPQNEEVRDIVFVAETGRVYHTYRDCTHLKLDIQPTTGVEVPNKRNRNNGKYTACEICMRNKSFAADTVLYITTEGDRYHIKADCSGLKRTVYEKDRAEVEGKFPCCKRCSKRDAKNKKEAEGEVACY